MEIERIIGELNREYRGEPWHGSSLRSILDGITAAHATARPMEAGHSIFELVRHVTAWKNEVRRRLSGAPAGDPEEGDWPPVAGTSPDEWRLALKSLDAAHDALTAAVRAFPEARLDEPSNDPRDASHSVTYYVLLHGSVQHDVYHAGQIALLKKALTAPGD